MGIYFDRLWLVRQLYTEPCAALHLLPGLTDHKLTLINIMPRSRSRSPPSRRSPQRRRSRSPLRPGSPYDRDREPERERNRDRDRDRRDKPKSSGFKWKEKRRDEGRSEEPKRPERGYRNRSQSPRRNMPSSKGSSIEDKFGVTAKFGTSVSDKFGSASKTTNDTAIDTSKPPPRAAATANAEVASGEPMIIVHVNDRLGTKAAIPCLASDPVKLFKAQVAARIGRQPHEIMLKRQGERPFKDQLTLEDYGVSNGVQLDLEIDTGD